MARRSKSKSRRFSSGFWSARLASFDPAWFGLKDLARTQGNFKLQLGILALVILLGFICGFDRWDWTYTMLAAGLVLAAEAGNTAIEALGDALGRKNEAIGRAKDLGAASVLLASLFAALVGIFTFFPYIAYSFIPWVAHFFKTPS